MSQQQSNIITSMATPPTTTTKQLLQHPSHEHPLEPLDSPVCRLCHRKISAEAYTCQERCETCYYHKVCVEAPSQIDRHPLHPAHPLPLIHHRPGFCCDVCREHFDLGGSSFRCHECDFNLDTWCALSTLSDEGGSLGGKTSEPIILPDHCHSYESFFSRYGFIGDSKCYIQDLFYADWTKAPQVYHGHPLEIFVGEDTGSTRCASCKSNKSGEFIGCASCQVFYHRHCFQVPEILQYPSHNPDHTLVPFLDIGTLQQCQSCSSSLKDEIFYRCTSCEFFVHALCGFQVHTYCEEGMSAKIKLSWHKHPLLLCHRTESASNVCFYCEDESIGPTYVCEEKDCGFLLHKRCMEIESTITHPHHPDHPLTLCEEDYDDRRCFCKACGLFIHGGLKLSCKRCFAVDFHVTCADFFPTHKHYLHEHKLLRLEEYGLLECNRCSTSNDSTVFRCVPCDFNLHEECMELPKVMRNNKIHWHPLTLHETFVEDDSGEYYCEHCEKKRDPRLGVYVCEYCKISLPRIYHIHCVLSELENVYIEKSQPSATIGKLCEQIADQTDEVRAIEEKVKEAKEKLDELVKQRNKLLGQDSDNESCEDSENESIFVKSKIGHL